MPTRPSPAPLPPGGHPPLASRVGVEARSSLTLDELRRLAGRVASLAPEDVPAGRESAAATFNGAVARFREQVVLARNLMILGRAIPDRMRVELRALSEALPGERARATGPGTADRAARDGLLGGDGRGAV